MFITKRSCRDDFILILYSITIKKREKKDHTRCQYDTQRKSPWKNFIIAGSSEPLVLKVRHLRCLLESWLHLWSFFQSSKVCRNNPRFFDRLWFQQESRCEKPYNIHQTTHWKVCNTRTSAYKPWLKNAKKINRSYGQSWTRVQVLLIINKSYFHFSSHFIFGACTGRFLLVTFLERTQKRRRHTEIAIKSNKNTLN